MQLGDADVTGEVHGYVPPGAKEERKVPLELSLKVSRSPSNLDIIHMYRIINYFSLTILIYISMNS